MKPLVTGLLLSFALILSCTRQPVGITGSSNTVIAPPTESDAATPDPRTEQAMAERPDASQRVMETPERSTAVPQPADVKALRNTRRTTTPAAVPAGTDLAENETARIENQGAVGEADLSGSALPKTESSGGAPLMTFQKSNCYGDCEAYTFDLRTGGLSSLRVDQGAIAEGLYNRQLYSIDYDRLNNSIDSLRGLDLAPVYPEEAPIPTDIPYRLVTLPDLEGNPRSIKVYGGAPPALKRFLDRLELLISEQSWERATEQDDDRE
ncbi:DUF6438 domain-containing protein [Lewinella sp. IMCC34183]|uniref:DUF6438 domain-containing protein n=1 Tax=Lewinella sp. IMCC34183 TaxID=2248762 RepID=UPI000E25F7C2|nr:DUF6438 domain-containing protein [Lewinella sp. IMCC34183]